MLFFFTTSSTLMNAPQAACFLLPSTGTRSFDVLTSRDLGKRIIGTRRCSFHQARISRQDSFSQNIHLVSQTSSMQCLYWYRPALAQVGRCSALCARCHQCRCTIFLKMKSDWYFTDYCFVYGNRSTKLLRGTFFGNAFLMLVFGEYCLLAYLLPNNRLQVWGRPRGERRSWCHGISGSRTMFWHAKRSRAIFSHVLNRSLVYSRCIVVTLSTSSSEQLAGLPIRSVWSSITTCWVYAIYFKVYCNVAKPAHKIPPAVRLYCTLFWIYLKPFNFNANGDILTI